MRLDRNNKIEVPEDVLFWAFRYALGRPMAAVASVVHALVKHAPQMTGEAREMIAREIEVGKIKHGLGIDEDRLEWIRVRDAMRDPRNTSLDTFEAGWDKAVTLPGAEWNPVVMPMVPDAVGETLTIGRIIRFYSDGAVYGSAAEKRLGSFGTVEGAKDAVERAAWASLAKLAPVPELDGALPLILYFDTEAERQDFVSTVQTALPNLKTRDL